jgi:hypothetical protein
VSQKKVKDKMVRPGDFADKGLGLSAARDESALELICVQECVIPGAGRFLAGASITDPVVIAKLLGSPCFKPAQEVE